MPTDHPYPLSRDEPETSLRELDDVVLLAPATTDDGDLIPAGTEGTIVGVWRDGEAFFVEFAAPGGALAAVRPLDLRRTGRHAP